MTQARVRVEPVLAKLSTSEWETLIYEANLGTEGSDIARRYFINRECQIDIAIDKDVDRKTICRRTNDMKRRFMDIISKIPS